MLSIVPLFVLYYSSILPLGLAVFTAPAVLHPRQATSKPSGLDFGGLVTQPPATVAIQRRPVLFFLYYFSILPLVLAVFTLPTMLRPRPAPSKPSGFDFGGLVTQPPAKSSPDGLE